jgi:thioredoxin reductase (NADPH)
LDHFEVLVIGGGPAGLSASLYLARYARRVALFDAGQGRSTWHQVNHNYLGFPGGIPARQLRERGYEQLAEYDEEVTVLRHKVETLARGGDGFIASGQAGEWTARAVILCTGVIDHYPHFEGWDAYVGRSMFWCITCDGYACKGQKVVVAGHTDETASMAMQLTRMTDDVTLLTNSESFEISDRFVKRLDRAGVRIVRDKIDEAVGQDGLFEALILKSGDRLPLEQLFSHQGATPQTELAEQLGVLLAANGYILTDSEQKTSEAGVYAAGDVTRLHSHQITTAVHEGGTAASAANYYLYPPELKDE